MTEEAREGLSDGSKKRINRCKERFDSQIQLNRNDNVVFENKVEQKQKERHTQRV